MFSSCKSLSAPAAAEGPETSDGRGGTSRRSDVGGRRKGWSRITSMSRFSSFGRRNTDSFRDDGFDGDDRPQSRRPADMGRTCVVACRHCGSSIRSSCERRAHSAVSALDQKRAAWLTKIKGGDILPPPGLPGRDALFALLGILLCLMIMSGANEMISRFGYHEHSMILSAFGGLVVNLFCLPASPNSQPRNCLFGLTINVFVGMAFRRIPPTVLPTWARGAISPAVSISAMAYLGYIHPPAGGAAVAFALGKEDEWLELGLLLFGWTMSVAFASVYNNLSEKRAYPNYWRFLWLPDALYKRVHRWKKRKRDKERRRREKEETMQLSRHVMDHQLVRDYMEDQQQEKQGAVEQV
uniref:HPP transmembrane region domain-containing protein n=1 Tax=Odontella aurita TaxID=265563 RepID=A0A7S4M8H0_9STRA